MLRGHRLASLAMFGTMGNIMPLPVGELGDEIREDTDATHYSTVNLLTSTPRNNVLIVATKVTLYIFTDHGGPRMEVCMAGTVTSTIEAVA